MEEKACDVDVCALMLLGGPRGVCDQTPLVSNDSKLVTRIEGEGEDEGAMVI